MPPPPPSFPSPTHFLVDSPPFPPPDITWESILRHYYNYHITKYAVQYIYIHSITILIRYLWSSYLLIAPPLTATPLFFYKKSHHFNTSSSSSTLGKIGGNMIRSPTKVTLARCHRRNVSFELNSLFCIYVLKYFFLQFKSPHGAV